METVYLETTIIGHLAGRLLGDPIVAARQRATRRWWDVQAQKYRIFISYLVIDECSGGDTTAVDERLRLIADLDVVGGSTDADGLANALIEANAIPRSEPRDAMHISLAATNGVQYLLTWNFRHIANAQLRPLIEATCRLHGYEPPVICTPDELMGLEING